MREGIRKKLRVPPLRPPFEVALIEPEIPQNTGNIARLCAATQSTLHLVGALGFRLDERSVRRAGIDYWHLVDLRVHPDESLFFLGRDPSRVKLFSANAPRSYLDAGYAPGDLLVFGRESTGLPEEIQRRYVTELYGIPTAGAVRSINLASAVAIVVYEALRSVGALAGALPEAPPEGTQSARGDDDDDFVR